MTGRLRCKTGRDTELDVFALHSSLLGVSCVLTKQLEHAVCMTVWPECDRDCLQMLNVCLAMMKHGCPFAPHQPRYALKFAQKLTLGSSANKGRRLRA